MKILSVAYPLFPVYRDAAGGAEQVLSLLDREYCQRGLDSVVVAAHGSAVSGQLIETPCTSDEITDDLRHEAQKWHAEAIRRAIRDHRIDLIHFHGLDFFTYVPNVSIPMLATVHLPLAWYPQAALQETTYRVNCVSHMQAADTGLPVVANGIDTNRYVPRRTKGDYFLWLGRVCPEKGVHTALEAARNADVPLRVAGPVHPFPSHQNYFREMVEPLLDDQRVYVGPVCGSEKLRLLAEAKALLVTSSVAETSSLVAMEAASSGTPVLAMASGALPEVVEEGRTGWIVHSKEELEWRMRNALDISPVECRRVATARFSAKRMADDYLALYTRIFGITCAPQNFLYVS